MCTGMNGTPENMDSGSIMLNGKNKSAGVVCYNECVCSLLHVVTDFINALPGKGSVYTV
jgi:hypothetical protein